MKNFEEVGKEKIIIFDGAMGTNIQALNLNVDDYDGEKYFGCYEFLTITKPTLIEQIHSDFLSVGCDVIETNTFNANQVSLKDHFLSHRAYEINYKAAMIAKRAASDYFSESHPRFVAGSIGPTNKFPALGQISFMELSAAYHIQAKGLIEGGVDVLIIETCQDLLQIKAALYGIFECFKELKKKVPIIVSLALVRNQKTITGSDIETVLTAIQPYEIYALGINCVCDIPQMQKPVQYLSKHSPFNIIFMPNAGIPEKTLNGLVYQLTPEIFSKLMRQFVEDFGVNIIGGCCGTTKEHIKYLVEQFGGIAPPVREYHFNDGF